MFRRIDWKGFIQIAIFGVIIIGILYTIIFVKNLFNEQVDIYEAMLRASWAYLGYIPLSIAEISFLFE